MRACRGRRFSLRRDPAENVHQAANVEPQVRGHAHSPGAPGSLTTDPRSSLETAKSGTRWQACRGRRHQEIRIVRYPEADACLEAGAYFAAGSRLRAAAPPRFRQRARREVPESPNCELERAPATQAWKIDSQAAPRVALACQSSSGRFRPPISLTLIQFGALICVEPAFFASSAPALQVGWSEL